MQYLLMAGALVTTFSTQAIACEDAEENRMTPDREAVLYQVDELNKTETGIYVQLNNIGIFAEVSMTRCNSNLYDNDNYVGQTAFVLNQPYPKYEGRTDEEYKSEVEAFSLHLAHHICVLNETDPQTSNDRLARDAATALMSQKAYIEAKYELTDNLVKPLEQLHSGDMSVCGEVEQRYQTLVLQ